MPVVPFCKLGLICRQGPSPAGETRMRSLTNRQEQILEWIERFIQEYGIPPTRAEFAVGVGLKDASCVGPHLQTLADGGWIQLLPGKNR